jgi:hypothetical protein
MVCLCPSAHLNNCSDQVMDMAQVQQIYARLFTHIDVATASQAGLGRRRILLRAGRPPALRTPPASLSISTLPRPPPAALGTVLLHSAPYHSCLPRYKALANYPLRSRRRLHGPSGLPTAWQIRLNMWHVQRGISSSDIRYSMDADPYQWHQQNEYGNGQWEDYSNGLGPSIIPRRCTSMRALTFEKLAYSATSISTTVTPLIIAGDSKHFIVPESISIHN